MGATAGSGRGSSQVAPPLHTDRSCGSHDGGCMPQGMVAATTMPSSVCGGVLVKLARQDNPSAGGATKVAVHRPARTTPGRLLRAGTRFGGRMKRIVTPGTCGTTVMAASDPCSRIVVVKLESGRRGWAERTGRGPEDERETESTPRRAGGRRAVDARKTGGGALAQVEARLY